MKEFKPKISIIGCGNVGMRYAYALIIKGIARQIIMIDINVNILKGEVMDLSHTAPFVSPVEVIDGDYIDIKDSDLVVITAGKKQKIGQTRLDLAKSNVELFRSIIPEIIKYSPNSIFLVVSNPVDILSYCTYKLSKKKSNEIIGAGTLLDSARLRYLIGKHCKIDSRNIHAYILGEHGDTEVPIWSKAMIGGFLIDEYCQICDNNTFCNRREDLNKIFKSVRDSAYKIIEKKGETSYGIGLSLVRITEAILNDENAILPVSTYINNYLGISDLYLSLPTIINKNGVRKFLQLELNEDERKQLVMSAKILKDALNSIQI